ncbi:MAG: sigma 54-interacting transcriptional regulator [Myxococcota bacterium]
MVSKPRRASPMALGSLAEISQLLTTGQELTAPLHRVLERLEKDHGFQQAAISLLDPTTEETAIAASLGLASEAKSARYKSGEGITGRVLESGRPIVVPAISKEPLFLHRAFHRPKGAKEQSFVAVPILVAKKPAGVLTASFAADGARDYEELVKGFSVVGSMIGQALVADRAIKDERQRLLEENTSLRQELKERYDLSNIIGTAGPMRLVYEQIAQVARSSTTVLIRGESGTGKELIAHAIHYSSTRAKKAFVKVSCAALPEALIESELFGYERGAFTGAEGRKKGRFEAAEGGTLFLDEIGEINLSTQIKLLRVLQEREFERLGGNEPIRANVRLVTATNKDLEQALVDRSFREDLYYRLNVFTIFVPPLRERKSDVMLLADHFLTKYGREHKKSIKRISTPAIDMLMSYHWPGNVRELENIIERAVLVCDGQVIHGHHLPPTLQTAEASGTEATASLEKAVEQLERDMILDALKSTRGNQAKAARLLQTTERILAYKVKKYEIDAERFKR